MKTLYKLTIVMISILFSNLAFSGIEDWQGTFTIQNADGYKSTITHNSIEVVIFSMLHCTKTFRFGEHSTINGFSPKEPGELDVIMNIDDFAQQVKKLGSIVDQQIILGSTYLKY